MPRGRQPEGEHALSDAERCSLSSAASLAAQSPPVVRRPADRRSSRSTLVLMQLQNSSPCKPNFAARSDSLPGQPARKLRPAKRCLRPSSNSISMISPRSSRRAAMAGTEQPHANHERQETISNEVSSVITSRNVEKSEPLPRPGGWQKGSSLRSRAVRALAPLARTRGGDDVPTGKGAPRWCGIRKTGATAIRTKQGRKSHLT